jgi:hypothetical protein
MVRARSGDWPQVLERWGKLLRDSEAIFMNALDVLTPTLTIFVRGSFRF